MKPLRERLRETVNFGVFFLATDRGPHPVSIARAAEERGIDMLFIPENTHVPVQRDREWPDAEHLVDPLSRLYDPFVALAACAAATERILLGVAVCLLTQRDPIATAKTVASLDHVAAGRLILGVAGGRIGEAMENHGAAFGDRWKIVRERTLAMQTIWREELAEYHGEFVDFTPMHSYPKPLQAGGPPVWVGSNSKWVPGRVAEYADGWIVFHGRYAGDPIADLRAACVRRERNFDELTLALMDAPLDFAAASEFIARGFRQLIFWIKPDCTAVMAELDRIAELVQRLRGLEHLRA